ncbi:uncharacterized protein BO80DRAFT_97770 [Aspergillus ibericus CBS 121593]|uniref:Uncharacterized protein n=1 Tax=Aspergillus ibericus CBS 121593 TaxID=1448316 RepID=A0A395GYM4_9EURO|nr:hypothetical protein BO80DRAFT_97770 [Aspergillus ibericus CBS 121593]RAL00423.1 hypothetical protein BO80DRAFT_97770 [Aspergillus ibericus CBS 121593]
MLPNGIMLFPCLDFAGSAPTQRLLPEEILVEEPLDLELYQANRADRSIRYPSHRIPTGGHDRRLGESCREQVPGEIAGSGGQQTQREAGQQTCKDRLNIPWGKVQIRGIETLGIADRPGQVEIAESRDRVCLRIRLGSVTVPGQAQVGNQHRSLTNLKGNKPKLFVPSIQHKTHRQSARS